MDSKQLTILLVDDDEDDYIITQDLLSELEGYTIELDWVSTFDQGLEKACGDCYDVYLFDYNLGSRNGLELLEHVLENGCKGPIILLTGQGDHSIDVKAMEAGAADYLIKGQVDAIMLERSIRYAIEHRQSRDKILEMAYYDDLTKLPNRALFQDRLQQGITMSRRHKRNTAILFLDLDNFKRINDTLGHNVGDMLLKEVADRFSECIRDTDSIYRHNPAISETTTIARLGGDEFTLLLTEINDPHDAAKVAQRILNTLDKPFKLEGHEFIITASIGIALYPHDGEHIDTLLKNADIAMYHAKEQGKNNYQFYRRSMNEAALEKLTLENELRRALLHEEFVLYYQPQINIERGEVVGLEALIRWNHPTKGLVMPGKFIPLAEEMGLICSLGEWVIENACCQNKAWQDGGLPAVPVSVNLSSQQFQQQTLPLQIEKILQDTGLSPENLILEITESCVMDHTDKVMAVVNQLTEMNIGLSLDDFGTGYSSLSSLKRLLLHSLKVDQSFVRDITTNPDDAAIVATIIAMTKTLNLEVVAEGVETEEQLHFLFDKGCPNIQGYLFSRPLAADDVPAFFEKIRNKSIPELKNILKGGWCLVPCSAL